MSDMKNKTMEEWRAIKGLGGYYEVSSLGNIRRVKPGKNAKLFQNRKLSRTPNGYLSTEVYVDRCRRCTVHVHRAVAIAFLGDPPAGKTQVNHRNGVKTDNRVENLEWVSQSENMRHAQHELGWLGRPGVRVVKLDHDGKLLGTFDSVLKAAQSVGGGASVRKNISAVCSMRHRRVDGPPYRFGVRGFIWMYESDYSPVYAEAVVAQIKLHRRPNARRTS